MNQLTESENSDPKRPNGCLAEAPVVQKLPPESDAIVLECCGFGVPG